MTRATLPARFNAAGQPPSMPRAVRASPGRAGQPAPGLRPGDHGRGLGALFGLYLYVEMVDGPSRSTCATPGPGC